MKDWLRCIGLAIAVAVVYYAGYFHGAFVAIEAFEVELDKRLDKKPADGKLADVIFFGEKMDTLSKIEFLATENKILNEKLRAKMSDFTNSESEQVSPDLEYFTVELRPTYTELIIDIKGGVWVDNGEVNVKRIGRLTTREKAK